MTAATDMHCLSDETLAAYLDGKLDEAARDPVMEHLASCDECRSRAIEVSRTLKILTQRSDAEPPTAAESSEGEELADPEPAKPDNPPNVVPLKQQPQGRRWSWTAAAGAVAAAAVFAVVLIPVFDKPGIPELVDISRELKGRKYYGQLSGGFPHKPTDIKRGPGDDPVPVTSLDDDTILRASAGEILNGTDLHAKGVMELLLGDQQAAVMTLQKALAQDPGSRAIQQDLAVALLQRGAAGDEQKSLEISNGLWAAEQTREVAWNRAYALQNMQHYEEAVAAWDEYLKLEPDPESPWRKEAVQERNLTQEMVEISKRNPQLSRP